MQPYVLCFFMFLVESLIQFNLWIELLDSV